SCDVVHLALHSFPTRRSSDLDLAAASSACAVRASTSPESRRRRLLPFEKGFPLRPRSLGPNGDGSSAASGVTGPSLIMTRRSWRSEEHTSELQSLAYIVCRLL